MNGFNAGNQHEQTESMEVKITFKILVQTQSINENIYVQAFQL